MAIIGGNWRVAALVPIVAVFLGGPHAVADTGTEFRVARSTEGSPVLELTTTTETEGMWAGITIYPGLGNANAKVRRYTAALEKGKASFGIPVEGNAYTYGSFEVGIYRKKLTREQCVPEDADCQKYGFRLEEMVSYISGTLDTSYLAPFPLLPAVAQKKRTTPVASVAGRVTYGSYSGSLYRNAILTEGVALAWSPNEDVGVGLDVSHWDLTFKEGIASLRGENTTLSGNWFFPLEEGGSPGVLASVTYLTSNDPNIQGAYVPFGALAYSTADKGAYFDAGYAYSAYQDIKVNQASVTAGFAVFDWWCWSQTRVYYQTLSVMTQGKESTTAVEERFSWFAVPQTFTLTLSAVAGERIYGFDPDSKSPYSLPDILKGGAGVSATYTIRKRLTLMADVTWETYRNETADNSYSVVYGTLGAAWQF